MAYNKECVAKCKGECAFLCVALRCYFFNAAKTEIEKSNTKPAFWHIPFNQLMFELQDSIIHAAEMVISEIGPTGTS